jgi:formamidopyrimidine-DNA glycosylase
MPELPEVETIKNDLLPLVMGRRIVDVNAKDPSTVQRLTVESFHRHLVGRTITALERRGKYLIFHLDDGHAFIVHLRMTGSLLLDAPEPAPPETPQRSRVRATFHLDDGTRLSFVDRRRLGMIWLTRHKGGVVGSLGPEPLDSEFTPEVLLGVLSRRRAPIKAVLLDQEAIAGIGNMYADEALFRSRIHPLRPARDLSRQEVERLHRAIRETLSTAISHKGASVDTYVRPHGGQGAAHYDFMVAHRRGKSCPVCGTAIERIAVRNRGTFFCPRCQKHDLHSRDPAQCTQPGTAAKTERDQGTGTPPEGHRRVQQDR